MVFRDLFVQLLWQKPWPRGVLCVAVPPCCSLMALLFLAVVTGSTLLSTAVFTGAAVLQQRDPACDGGPQGPAGLPCSDSTPMLQGHLVDVKGTTPERSCRVHRLGGRLVVNCVTLIKNVLLSNCITLMHANEKCHSTCHNIRLNILAMRSHHITDWKSLSLGNAKRNDENDQQHK